MSKKNEASANTEKTLKTAITCSPYLDNGFEKKILKKINEIESKGMIKKHLMIPYVIDLIRQGLNEKEIINRIDDELKC